MSGCKNCKRLGISIARFGGGTVIFFLGLTVLLAGKSLWSQMGARVFPPLPWVAGLLFGLIFIGSGLCILFAWMWKHAFMKVGVVFIIAAVVALFNGGVLMTTLGGGVWPLFLLGFFCFGLAVNCPRHANLMWTSFGNKKSGGCCNSPDGKKECCSKDNEH